jgi:tripartite ATP-independent transporter DctM subunit
MMELMPLLMFLAAFIVLLAGYPVALTLAGVALSFAFVGIVSGSFDVSDLGFLTGRLFGIVTNQTLIAVPLFVLMGVMLEKSRIAETLLDSMSILCGRLRGGLGISVTLVGMLMAASTGIVGATVVTMGLMSLPTMLRHGYDKRLATGTICATGTLGQIIPPSIALVLLGDVMSNAYQEAQLSQGIFAPRTVSVGDLFAGAVFPGLLLVLFYVIYILVVALVSRERAPLVPMEELSRGRAISIVSVLLGLAPPLLLIIAVLGSILAGIATPTEAAGVGALGALLLALFQRQINYDRLKEVARSTTETTAMVFFILIGASVFSLVFRGYGGDELVQSIFTNMPGGVVGATIIVMLVIFLLGFILDFIEITFVVVPIIGPVLLSMGLDPVWLGIMIAVNLQTSFLTPPFGFSLFYLRGVAPPEVRTQDIYRGVVPFVALQLLLLAVLALWPDLAIWLPAKLYG